MPVFNASAYLADAVESILGQTFADFELIAVDDGSTDDSAQLLARYSAGDPRVRVIRKNNEGVARTLEVARKHARGRYLARMDADDIAAPARFARQAGFLDAHPAVAVVGSAIQNIDGQGRAIGAVQTYPCADAGIRAALLAGGSPLAHPAVMMRRDAIAEAGGYRRAYDSAEDYDLWLRISERHQIANLAEPLLFYRYHGAAVSNRHAFQSTLATLAASRAAALRAAGKPDPSEGCDELTPKVLAALRIDARAIQWIHADSYRGRASVLLLTGETDAAAAMLEDYRNAEIPDWVRRKLYPEIEFLQARLATKRGKPLVCARHVLGAIGHDWRFIGALWGKLLRRFRAANPATTPWTRN